MSDTKQCECADPVCPFHVGEAKCEESGSVVLFRIDQTDETGTLFCEECAEDAFGSGLFRDQEEK